MDVTSHGNGQVLTHCEAQSNSLSVELPMLLDLGEGCEQLFELVLTDSNPSVNHRELKHVTSFLDLHND